MKKATEYTSDNKPAILLVGEPKSGKSRLAAGAPKPFILDCDRNLGSVINSGVKDFLFESITDPPNLTDIKNKNETPWALAMAAVKEAALSPEVESIVIDSLSTLSDCLITHILYEVKRQEGKVLDNLRIQDYRLVRKLFVNLIAFLRSSGKYIIVTSHQKTQKDEITGVLRYQLNIPGQLADNFGAFFSDVWATEAKSSRGAVSYCVYTKPTVRHVSLGSSINLDAQIDITNLSPKETWSKIMGGV